MSIPVFLDAAADWADSRKVRMTFARDAMGDWYATVYLSDSRGEFTAVVTPPGRDRYKPKPTPEEYAARVAKACGLAAVQARRHRMTTHTGVPVSRHYGDEARAS